MADIITIPKFKNLTGTISVIEKKIKFKIKRVYFIYDIKGDRGGHKHKKTKQFLICLNGKCELIIFNKKTKKISLTNANKGVLLYPNDWHEIKKVSKGSVIVVLASEYYDSKDYIAEKL
jgi:dTDP-4-dehydrorhamnose 3,5-epimerase-like enzyme